MKPHRCNVLYSYRRVRNMHWSGRKSQIQRCAEDDRVRPLQHLGSFIELLLQLSISDHLRSLTHLSDKLS